MSGVLLCYALEISELHIGPVAFESNICVHRFVLRHEGVNFRSWGLPSDGLFAALKSQAMLTSTLLVSCVFRIVPPLVCYALEIMDLHIGRVAFVLQHLCLLAQ